MICAAPSSASTSCGFDSKQARRVPEDHVTVSLLSMSMSCIPDPPALSRTSRRGVKGVWSLEFVMFELAWRECLWVRRVAVMDAHLVRTRKVHLRHKLLSMLKT